MAVSIFGTAEYTPTNPLTGSPATRPIRGAHVVGYAIDSAGDIEISSVDYSDSLGDYSITFANPTGGVLNNVFVVIAAAAAVPTGGNKPAFSINRPAPFINTAGTIYSFPGSLAPISDGTMWTIRLYGGQWNSRR